MVKAPIQRNSREENAQIKEGKIPEDWSAHKKSQKDTDANWTKKHGKNLYGYKNHIKVDAKIKLIDDFQVTQASTHDSKVLLELIDETDKGKPIWADSAYDSEEIRKELRRRKTGCRIHKKGSRHVTLTKLQQVANHIKSRTRCRVEHIFASIHNRTKGLGIRCIALARATAEITLQNLVYNINRMIYLDKMKRISVSD